MPGDKSLNYGRGGGVEEEATCHRMEAIYSCIKIQELISLSRK